MNQDQAKQVRDLTLDYAAMHFDAKNGKMVNSAYVVEYLRELKGAPLDISGVAGAQQQAEAVPTELEKLNRYDHRGALMVPDPTGDYCIVSDVRELIGSSIAAEAAQPVTDLPGLADYEHFEKCSVGGFCHFHEYLDQIASGNAGIAKRARKNLVDVIDERVRNALKVGRARGTGSQHGASCSGWVSVADGLPEKYCLAAYQNRAGRHRIIRAMSVKQYEIEATGDECDSETNDADDMEYIKAGWYECIDNWGDYSSVKVCEGEVTHWMPLPPLPGESSATRGAAQGRITQPDSGVRWDLFPSYLIDHCEGDIITEEGLQHSVVAMLKDPDYLRVVGESGTATATSGALPADVEMHNRIVQRLVWLENGAGINVPEFVNDVRALIARIEQTDEQVRKDHSDAIRYRFLVEQGGIERAAAPTASLRDIEFDGKDDPHTLAKPHVCGLAGEHFGTCLACECAAAPTDAPKCRYCNGDGEHYQGPSQYAECEPCKGTGESQRAAAPVSGDERDALIKLCDQLNGMRRRLRDSPTSNQHESYLFADDVDAYVEQARAAVAAFTVKKD